MAQFDVCVVGEINPDLILYGVPKEVRPETESLIQGYGFTLGGSSAICAHNLAVLGARVAFVSKIGSDALGKMVQEWVSSGGVDVSRVREVSTGSATGLTVVLMYATERSMLTYPGTMLELSYDDLDLDYVFSARHLHVSSFFLQKALRPKLAQLFSEARRAGLTTSLDTNDDPEDAWGDDLCATLRHVDIFFPNEREAKKVARTEDLTAAIDWLSERVGIVAVKLGARGALARKGRQEWQCAPLRVNVVDAVGAGDTFDAGFIYRFLQGAGVQACLDFANVAAACSTTRVGGTEAYRDREAMAKFFREHTAS